MKKVRKTVGLVAHDNRKKDLMEWIGYNSNSLIEHDLICTGTTGRLAEETLRSELSSEKFKNLKITRLKSGPLGGDQQLGALISEGKIDILLRHLARLGRQEILAEEAHLIYPFEMVYRMVPDFDDRIERFGITASDRTQQTILNSGIVNHSRS